MVVANQPKKVVNQKVNIGWKPLFIKRNGVRYIIMMGGRGAGRSYAASQYATARLIEPTYFRCAIMRLVHEDIRNSIWQEIVDRVDDQGITDNISVSDSNMRMRFTVKHDDGTTHVNSINALGFTASGKRSAKLKSLASYNTIIIEEAEEIGEAEFMQLDDSLRTVKDNVDITVVLCMNTPPRNHWIIQKWFNLQPIDTPGATIGFTVPSLKPECAEDTEFLYFNFRSNVDNLDAHTVKRYLDYRNTKPDYYYHKIEGYCPDIVRGRIYSGWQLIDAVPHEAKLMGRGLDFGWWPDPLHLCNVYFYNGGYILDQLLHGNHISNETVAVTIKKDESNQRAVTFADSAEPKSIQDIADEGVNIVGVEKGKGSVEHRIKVVNGLRISVTRRSTKLWEGYETYAWKEDKDGNPLGIPAHPGSDPMDASGYCLVSIVDYLDPEEEQKQAAQYSATHQEFVQQSTNRYGL